MVIDFKISAEDDFRKGVECKQAKKQEKFYKQAIYKKKSFAKAYYNLGVICQGDKRN